MLDRVCGILTREEVSTLALLKLCWPRLQAELRLAPRVLIDTAVTLRQELEPICRCRRHARLHHPCQESLPRRNSPDPRFELS